MISPHRSMRPGRGHTAGRSASLVTQLAIAFVAVALVTVAVVAFWAHRIADQHLAAYHERIGLTDSPPDVRELILRSGRPMRFALSQRRFLAGVNQSLWFGGGTAAVLSVLAAIVLAHRFTQPLRKLQGAAAAVASGNLDQTMPVRGGGELEDVAAAFNLMTERLRESERQRHQLLAAVAHELRTPLAIIQGNLEAMLFQTTAPTPERLSALHTQSALLNRLITDLLDLSLAEAGQLTLHRRAIDLAALCREAVEVMQPWIDERGVKVEIQVGNLSRRMPIPTACARSSTTCCTTRSGTRPRAAWCAPGRHPSTDPGSSSSLRTMGPASRLTICHRSSSPFIAPTRHAPGQAEARAWAWGSSSSS